MKNKKKPVVIMLCTAARGGMKTVVESYERDGLFAKWNVRLIYTHEEGSVVKRLWMFTKAIIEFIYCVVFLNVKMVHVHSAMRGSFWRKNIFSSIARLFYIPVLLHLHGSEMEKFYNEQSITVKKIIAKIFSKANVVIVLSESWKEFILKISPKTNVEIIHNYVVLPEKGVLNYQKPDKVRILFLGLIGHRKGVFDLINAMHIVIKQFDNFELFIGGNGDIESAQTLVKKLNLERHVQFLGWVNGSTKIEQLQSCDIYTLPSHNEGLPMSILEAMSYAKPIISTYVGGIPELVREKKDGLLFEAGNINKLAEAIVELCEAENKRLEYGANGRNRVESGFSEKVIIPQIDVIYKGLITEQGEQE